MARTGPRLVVAALALVFLACSAAPAETPTPESSGGPASTAHTSASDPASPTQPQGPQLAGQIEVTPSAVLMTARGQTARLVAAATGADGAAVPVAWSSSDPDQVTVDNDGNVTAMTDLGGALIYADAGDRTTPVVVLVAQPAPGAVLVADHQVVSAPQPLGDPNALPANGDRYRVSLSGIDTPNAGAILLATGSARIGGRVLSSSATASGIDVEYELVPLPVLLARYSFNFDVPLDPRDAGLAPVATNGQFASVDGALPGMDPGLAVDRKVEKEAEFEAGPLKCKASVAAKFSSTDFNIKATTDLSLQIEGRKEQADTTTAEHTKVVLTGPLSLDVLGGLKAEAGFEGSASCSLTKPIPVPIGGILALFLAVTIPIGLEATAEGKIKAVDVELGPKGHLGTRVTIGFECTNTICRSVTESTPDQNNGIKFESKVRFLRDMRVEASVGLNIVTGLGAHVGTEDYSLIDAKIGPVQAMNLAFDDAQVRDTGYASAYDLKIAGSVAPSDDLKKAVERLLGPVSLDLSLKYESQPLSSSPAGSLTADKARVQLGKPVTLSIDLDPKTIDYFLIGPNVDGLIISRWKDNALTQIATIPVSASAQTHFEYKWTPTREFLGHNDLVAFVQTLGLPAVPLEIAADSTTKVEVVEACIPLPTATPGVPPPGASVGPSSAPAPTPAQSHEPDPCGRGTVTITLEQHGTYTSPRDNPVQVDMVSTGTITFELVADELDPTSLTSETSSVTWSYSLTSTETGEECTTVEKADGGGTWEGVGGPTLLVGFASPDGTIFGMVLDETKYVLNALSPVNDLPEGDPRGWYQGSSSVCDGVFTLGIMFPYSAAALVDGPLPPGGVGTYSGSRTRELPVQFGYLPTTETVTWSFNVEPPQ